MTKLLLLFLLLLLFRLRRIVDLHKDRWLLRSIRKTERVSTKLGALIMLKKRLIGVGPIRKIITMITDASTRGTSSKY